MKSNQACPLRLINTLNQVIEKYGKPSRIRTDNGPDFTSHLFQNWLRETKIELVKIHKCKPRQNAIIEHLIGHIARIFWMKIYLEHLIMFAI